MNLRSFCLASCVATSGLVPACTLGVNPAVETRTASYGDTDWSTFRSVASPESSAMVIRGHAEPTVSVSASLGMLESSSEPSNALANSALTLARTEDVLELGLTFSGPSSEGVSLLDLTADLPASAKLDLGASDASIDVTNMIGDVRATTSDGSLRVETDGSVQLATSNGSVEGRASGGTVLTSNGGVTFVWQGANRAPLAVHTSNGAIVVHVPDGGGFTLDLATSNGDVNVNVGTTSVHDETFMGEINGGGPTLVVHTSNGSIDVSL